LCNELFIDAIAVRDRGLLGAKDYQVLEYAFNEERILVTANVRVLKSLLGLQKSTLVLYLFARVIYLEMSKSLL
jgi:predicted nuclease of predicted toxin-antitoxin system